MRVVVLSLALGAAVVAGHARDAGAFDQTVVQFRSVQDPAVVPDPAICARAPFVANTSLGASLYAFGTRWSDGVVDEDDAGRRLGTGTACIRITDTTFTPFTTLPYYSELTLKRVRGAHDVHLTMSGVCTLTSNDIPVAGLVLAACSLEVAPASPDIMGGTASSNSIFNPLRLPGFETGSYWTLRLFSGGKR